MVLNRLYLLMDMAEIFQESLSCWSQYSTNEVYKYYCIVLSKHVYLEYQLLPVITLQLKKLHNHQH
jgi:hypothetical protein